MAQPDQAHSYAPSIHPGQGVPTACGNPAAPRKIPFTQVDCSGKELQYVTEVLATGWLTSGKMVKRFETEFAKVVGARHACAVSSCTAGLHLALEAVGVGRGDTVLVPTTTFVASAAVAEFVGATPILLDVEYGSGLVSPQTVEEAIRRHPGVKAIIVVHLAGQPAKMLDRNGQGIMDVCRMHGVRVIEDAAHAFPARIQGRSIGSIGDATCFSFYATKTITTGEGGMLTTDDDAIAARVQLMRQHAITKDSWERISGNPNNWEYDVVDVGLKYNLGDLNAAIGLAQLERSPSLWAVRRACLGRYHERLAGIRGLDLQPLHVSLDDHACHLAMVVINDKAPIVRNDLMCRLSERGIGTSVHFKPLHRLTCFRKRYNPQPGEFPNAERMWKGSVSLPLFSTMTLEEVDYVCDNLLEILG